MRGYLEKQEEPKTGCSREIPTSDNSRKLQTWHFLPGLQEAQLMWESPLKNKAGQPLISAVIYCFYNLGEGFLYIWQVSDILNVWKFPFKFSYKE